MRSLIGKAVVLAAVFVVLGVGSARASTMEVKVPFPFVVQGRTLPAGQYRITNDGGLVQFHGERGNQAVLYVLTTPASGQDPAGDRPALTFTRHENQYRLHDIWQSATYGLEPWNR